MDHIFYQHIMSSGVRKADPPLLLLFGDSWTTSRQASLSFTISRSLKKFMSTESVRPSNHFILCHPLLLLPSIFPCFRVFSNGSTLCTRWPKYWCFSFSISPSNEYSELISFRIDWLDLLAVQGTFKSLLQHHISKALILQDSAFFMVQLSETYTITGKTIAFTIWTFVSKMRSLLLNMLSRFVIAFLPRSKPLRSSQTIPGKRLEDNCNKSFRKAWATRWHDFVFLGVLGPWSGDCT